MIIALSSLVFTNFQNNPKITLFQKWSLTNLSLFYTLVYDNIRKIQISFSEVIEPDQNMENCYEALNNNGFVILDST